METRDGTRWMAVGTSNDPDGRRAGAEAAMAALTGCSDSAAVVVAFGGPGLHARTALSHNASKDLRRAGTDGNQTLVVLAVA